MSGKTGTVVKSDSAQGSGTDEDAKRRSLGFLHRSRSPKAQAADQGKPSSQVVIPTIPDGLKQFIDRKLAGADGLAKGLRPGLEKAAAGTTSVAAFASLEDSFDKAKAFVKQLAKVDAVRTAYESARDDAESNAKMTTPPEGRTKEDWQAVAQAATQRISQLQFTLMPEDYDTAVLSPPWNRTLIGQLAPYTQGQDAKANTDTRAQTLADMLAQGSPARAKASADGQMYRAATEKYMVRGFERAATFQDAGRNGVAYDPTDRDNAEKALDSLAKTGTDILANGGSLKDVKDVMQESGLTEAFWPPQLVQSVQAWRKTQRTVIAERAQDLLVQDASLLDRVSSKTISILILEGVYGSELPSAVEEMRKADEEAAKAATEGSSGTASSGTGEATGTGDATGSSDATGGSDATATSDASGAADATGGGAGEATKAIAAAAVVNGIASGFDGIYRLYSIVKSTKELYETATDEDIEGREKALAMLGTSLEILRDVLYTAKDGVQMAKDFGGEALAQQLAKVVPGLSIAVAGTQLAAAGKELLENLAEARRARSAHREGLAAFNTDDEGEAFVNVLKNDLVARQTKVAKSGVEVTTTTMELTGAIAATAGGAHGAAAGAALSVTATTINLGAKVVFAGVDFARAREAMKTLREAQAGNMQAQVEVFEQSNFYAKMYLAVLARDGDPRARRYLIDEGIEQGDLDTPQSLRILREAMLDSAGQSDDTEADDTLMGRAWNAAKQAKDGIASLTPEDVARGAVIAVLGGGILAPITITAFDAGRRAMLPRYDAKAVGKTFAADATATEWLGAWRQMKGEHEANGLAGGADGLSTPITKAAEAVSAAQALLGRGDADPREMRTAVRAAMDSLKALLGVIASCSPVAYDPDSLLPGKIPHRQAIGSITSLRGPVGAVMTSLLAGLRGAMGVDASWSPAAIGTMPDPNWTAFWDDGVSKAGFPDDDAGVTTAIGKAQAAQKIYDAALDESEKRKPARRYMEALDRLNNALLDAAAIEEVRSVPGAGKEINAFMLSLNKDRRDLDGVLAGTDASGGGWRPPVPPDFKALGSYSDVWTSIWEYAESKGFTDGDDDGKFGSALHEFIMAMVDLRLLQRVDAPTKELLEPARKVESCAGRVKQCALRFCRSQRYAIEALKAIVLVYAEEVGKVAAKVRDEKIGANEPFDVVSSKEPAYLSSSDWVATYKNAVAMGAVPKDSTAKKGLAKALQRQKKARKKFDGNKAKDKATAYRDAIGVTLATIEMARGSDGWSRNGNMNAYLNTMRDTVVAARDAKYDPGQQTLDQMAA